MKNVLYLFVGLSNLLLSANVVVILNDRKIHVSFQGSLCFTSMVSLVSIRSGRWGQTQIHVSEVFSKVTLKAIMVTATATCGTAAVY